MEQSNKLLLFGGVLLLLGFLVARLAAAVQRSYAKLAVLFNVSAWIMLGVGFIFGILALVYYFKE